MTTVETIPSERKCEGSILNQFDFVIAVQRKKDNATIISVNHFDKKTCVCSEFTIIIKISDTNKFIYDLQMKFKRHGSGKDQKELKIETTGPLKVQDYMRKLKENTNLTFDSVESYFVECC